MTIQGAIFKQSNVKPPDEPPAKPIPPKPPSLQVEKTYTNACINLEEPPNTHKRSKHIYPQELLQEKPNCSPQRIILWKMRQQVIALMQVEGNKTGDSSNAHPLEETPTLRSQPQLPNYASRNQNQSNLAPTHRSPTPNPNSDDTQHRSTKRLTSEKKSLASIAVTVHTSTLMVQDDKTKRTHSMASTWHSHLMTQGSSFSILNEHKDYKPQTEMMATVHPSYLGPGYMETPELTRMQWKSMHQVHSRIASRLFPYGPIPPSASCQRNQS